MGNAISDGGPVLIEGNERWSTSLIQMPAPHGLMSGEFKALYEALGESEGVCERPCTRGR